MVRVISSACHIKQDKHWIVCVNKDSDEEMRLHPDDIDFLVVEHYSSTYTHQVLQLIANANIQFILCGKNHHPLALLQPIQNNHLSTQRLWLQIEQSIPSRKNLWKQIIQKKIVNQASVLTFYHKEGGKQLSHLSKKVVSGDKSNIEGQAAALYWKNLFGISFRRARDGKAPNNQLNYGYAILRAAISKSLVGTGLNPAIGLYHSNRSNAFCLTDDLMEVFRPWVDLCVYKLFYLRKKVEVDKEVKQQLISLLDEDVLIAKEQKRMLNAIDHLVYSYLEIISSKKKRLQMPILYVSGDTKRVS